MIRLQYEKDHPVFRDGRKTTGLKDYDVWWMDNSVLNSRWVEYGDKVLCAVRGVGTNHTGMSMLWAYKQSDLSDPQSWTIMHLHEPGVKATDMPAPFGNYPAPTTGQDLFVDPDTVTDGYQRLWYTFKSKESNLSSNYDANWNQSFTGGAVSATKNLGFSIAWQENVKLSVGGVELVLGVDYSLANLGTASNCVITYLTNQSANTVVFEYQRKAFRYSFYSDDGGWTWTYSGPFVGADGRPAAFGQPSAFKYDDGTHSWHMLTTATSLSPGTAFNYVRSTGPSSGTWTWEDDTKIADKFGAGWWNETTAIGTGDYIEDGYVYLFGTAGAGADIVWTGDPLTVEDLSTDIDPHFDYPSAVGLYRCPLNDMTNTASWEAYSQNPVMLRHSLGGSASGGIWNLNVIGSGGKLKFTHEAVGAIYTPISEAQSLNIKDSQYGRNYSNFQLNHIAAYASANITIMCRFVAKEVGFNLFKKGPDGLDSRNPDFAAGQYYCHVHDDGSVELVHFYQGGGAEPVRKSIRTDPGEIKVGVDHQVVVGMSPTGTRIFVDSNTASAIGGGATPNLDTSKSIIFGSSGLVQKDFHGYFEQVRMMNSYENYSTITSTTSALSIAWINFFIGHMTAGSPSTITDQSPQSNHAEVTDPCKHYSVVTETEVIVPKTTSLYMPGGGIGYNRGTGGSQQHQAFYEGNGLTLDWDLNPLPANSIVTCKNILTSRYIGETGTQENPYNWKLRRDKGFVRFEDDTALLYMQSTSRSKPSSTVELVAINTDYGSPYNRYDMQQWHFISHGDDIYSIQNRACSRVLADTEYGLLLVPWRGASNEKWRVVVNNN